MLTDSSMCVVLWWLYIISLFLNMLTDQKKCMLSFANVGQNSWPDGKLKLFKGISDICIASKLPQTNLWTERRQKKKKKKRRTNIHKHIVPDRPWRCLPLLAWTINSLLLLLTTGNRIPLDVSGHSGRMGELFYIEDEGLIDY